MNKGKNNSPTWLHKWVIIIGSTVYVLAVIICFIYIRFLRNKPYITLPPEDALGLLLVSGFILILLIFAMILHSISKMVVYRQLSKPNQKMTILLIKFRLQFIKFLNAISFPFKVFYINTIDRIPGLYKTVRNFWFNQIMPYHYRGYGKLKEKDTLLDQQCRLTMLLLVVPYLTVLCTLGADVLYFNTLNFFYYGIPIIIIPLCFKIFLLISKYIFYEIMLGLQNNELVKFHWNKFENKTYGQLKELKTTECYTFAEIGKVDGVSYDEWRKSVDLLVSLVPRLTAAVILIAKLQRQLAEDQRLTHFTTTTQCAYIFLWAVVFISCLLSI